MREKMRDVIINAKCFLLGIRECKYTVTTPTSRPEAYDQGREFAHKITRRRWDWNYSGE